VIQIGPPERLRSALAISEPPGPKAGRFGRALAPDRQFLAVEAGCGIVRLLDPKSEREYAQLRDPNMERSNPVIFSPDGTLLVTANVDSLSLHVWDLRALRLRLAGWGLDWELPPYPSHTAAPVKPLHITVRMQPEI
jgi:hypothetical protein